MMAAIERERDRTALKPRAPHTHRLIVGEEPKTPGQRMIKRRKELGLRQEDVAEKISYVRGDGVQATMSRSAYCMHEQDSVKHDVSQIERIAKALHTTPGYLAFGLSSDGGAVPEEDLNEDGVFEETHSWSVSPDWLYGQHGLEPADVVVFVANMKTKSVQSGDPVLLRRGVRPTADEGDFVFSEGGRAKIATVVRPNRNAAYIAVSADGKRTRELEAGTVFLGRVIRRLGAVE